jgi:hypothetical protein
MELLVVFRVNGNSTLRVQNATDAETVQKSPNQPLRATSITSTRSARHLKNADLEHPWCGCARDLLPPAEYQRDSRPRARALNLANGQVSGFSKS